MQSTRAAGINTVVNKPYQQRKLNKVNFHVGRNGWGKARRGPVPAVLLRSFGFTIPSCSSRFAATSGLFSRESRLERSRPRPGRPRRSREEVQELQRAETGSERHEATSDFLSASTMARDNRSPSLDPLHSPGSDAPPQSPVRSSSSSAQDAVRQNQATQDTADPMAKTKRRMFSTPLMRRSATASAASAASRIKSNLSTVTKLPTALKRTAANSGNANDNKATVDRAPTIPSLLRSSTESSVKQEEAKAAPQHTRMFGIPSLMSIRTGSKDKTHSVLTGSDCPLDSPENSSRGSRENQAEAEHKAAGNTASRFVLGVPAMLRRAVSNNHTPSSANAAAPLQKKSPDTSANSTPRGDSPEDELEENDRHSLLMMLQVPETQRRSQIPLMAASEAW